MSQKHFTAIIENDGDWYVAHCPEIPGATGQGPTAEDAQKGLAEAITMVLEDQFATALESVLDTVMEGPDGDPDGGNETVH